MKLKATEYDVKDSDVRLIYQLRHKLCLMDNALAANIENMNGVSSKRALPIVSSSLKNTQYSVLSNLMHELSSESRRVHNLLGRVDGISGLVR